MSKKALYIFPGTLHPVRTGSQVRANALLHHLHSDLGWQVDVLTPYGVLDPARWGEHWDKARAIHIPVEPAAAAQTAGPGIPNLRRALRGGVCEAFVKDLRHNLRCMTGRRDAAVAAPQYDLRSHINNGHDAARKPSAVSHRLAEHAKPHCREAVRALAAENEYDAVIVTYVWMSGLAEDIFGRTPRPTMICDTVDVQYVREARLEAHRADRRFDAAREKALEIEWLSRYDLLLGITGEDTAELERAVGRGKAVTVEIETPVPPGQLLSPEAWQARCDARHRFDLVFLGGLNEGNVYAVQALLDEVMPALLEVRPGLRIGIAGDICNTPAVQRYAHHPAVEVCGYVESAGDFLASGRVMAAPIPAGGGVKVKILDAMAHGLPVVTTPVGAEGTGLRDGVDGYVAADTALFARRVLELLDDPARQAAFAYSAQQRVLESLHASSVYAQLDRALGEDRAPASA